MNDRVFKDNPAYIDHYIDLGFEFKRVCKIKSTRIGNEWVYYDIDESVMFSTHRSWVYAITRLDTILKIGESGNPLGIKSNRSAGQPAYGTHSRFGRYRKGGSSDKKVRNMFRRQTQDSTGLTLYAIACPEIDYSINVLNEVKIIKAQIHKQLEKFLLDYYKEKIGHYPEANAGRY